MSLFTLKLDDATLGVFETVETSTDPIRIVGEGAIADPERMINMQKSGDHYWFDIFHVAGHFEGPLQITDIAETSLGHRIVLSS